MGTAATSAALPHDAARRDGSTRAAFPGAVSVARARREADTFPVLAHRVPVVICITFPCEARAAGDTAIPLENRDKG